MNSLVVNSVRTNANKLEIDFSCTGRMQKFFKARKFVAEYDTSIDETPESILVIPFLAAVCPVIWADNAEIFVNTCDETFVNSLEVVKRTLQALYPRMNFSGKLHVEKLVRTEVHKSFRRMVLFSSGIDALTTFVRHQPENPILFTVVGDGYPHSIVERAKELSDVYGLEIRIVKNSPLFILDTLMLALYTEKIYGDWYQRVMHSLALLGLCAPITHVDKVETIYIASSFTKEFQKPWGSCPEIDNNIKWTGTTVVHDAYELSRQKKIQLLADYIQKQNLQLQIRSCNSPTNPNNCSKCEKCSRTIVGLEMAGINPTKCGFLVQPDTALYIKNNLLKGNWNFGDDERFMWGDLQRHATHNMALPHPEMQSLIDWLLTADVMALKSKRTKKLVKLKLMVWKLVGPVIKYEPNVFYRISRKVYYCFYTN